MSDAVKAEPPSYSAEEIAVKAEPPPYSAEEIAAFKPELAKLLKDRCELNSSNLASFHDEMSADVDRYLQAMKIKAERRKLITDIEWKITRLTHLVLEYGD